MRIIGEIDNEKYCHAFSQFLNYKDIAHQIEIIKNVDWGSADYGLAKGLIWIQEEDQVEEAQRYLTQFQENPNDPTFTNFISAAPLQTVYSDQDNSEKREDYPQPSSREPTMSRENLKPMGPVTKFLLIACTLIFLASQFFISKEYKDQAIPLFFSSPIEKMGLYDFPYTYQLVDRAFKEYGLEGLENPKTLPPEGQKLIKQINDTPFWQGFYHLFLQKNKDTTLLKEFEQTPKFEKIQQGEIWRLISPCFLHADLFHLFFNMLWLFVLGKQIESRLRTFKYIFFILILGVFSNTFQYLMSGPNFIGFSGILCGMLTFVWMRQKYAPWEGYQLDKSTIIFMLLFIFGMAAIQFFSFFLEKVADLTISPGIANMAHISGALFGIVLGKLKFFSWRSA